MDEADDEATTPQPATLEVTVTVAFPDTLMSEVEGKRHIMRAIRLAEYCENEIIPALADRLTDPRLSCDSKDFATATAMMMIAEAFEPGGSGRCGGALQDRWAPMVAREYRAWMRGIAATAVAALDATEMKKPEIEMWLDKEIEVRRLDFTAQQAYRWFYDYDDNDKTKKFSDDDMRFFVLYRPEIGQSLTEIEAKRVAALRLDEVVATKIGPLTRPKRHG